LWLRKILNRNNIEIKSEILKKNMKLTKNQTLFQGGLSSASFALLVQPILTSTKELLLVISAKRTREKKKLGFHCFEFFLHYMYIRTVGFIEYARFP